MSIDSDEILNDLLDDEYRKIPVIFRSNKRISVAMFVVIGVFFIAALTFIMIWYDSGKYEVFSPGNTTYSAGVNVYNNTYMVFAILCLAVVVIAAAWLFLSEYYEKRAFAKASKLANRIHFSEMHRREVRRQEEKMLWRPKDNFGSDDDMWK